MDRTNEVSTRPSERLNSEWRGLCVDPAVNAEAASWRIADHEGRRCGSLAELLAACGDDPAIPMALADVTLAAVTRLAVGGDHLAARVVLQRLVSPLMREARIRAVRCGRDTRAVFDDLVSEAWLRILEYPIDRRPSKIAVNLIRDAGYALFGYPVLRTVRREVLTATGRVPEFEARRDGRASDFEASAAVVVDAMFESAERYGMDRDALELLVDIYVVGERRWVIARERGVTTRTVAKWRVAAERQLLSALDRGGEFCG